jgi:hypothetical protein
MSGESLLIILMVGLIAGWLAGQIVQGAPGSGLSATFSSESLVPSLAVGSFRNSASTSARALSRQSSTPPSGRCYCCWSSGSFVAEAGGIEVRAEVGEDAGNRRLAGRSFGGSLEGRAFWRVEIWKRRTIERAPYQEPHWRGLIAGRSWIPILSEQFCTVFTSAWGCTRGRGDSPPP